MGSGLISTAQETIKKLQRNLYNNHNCGTNVITKKLNELGYKGRKGQPLNS